MFLKKILEKSNFKSTLSNTRLVKVNFKEHITMFKSIFLVALLLLAINISFNSQKSAAGVELPQEKGYFVAELFTSQSCSSCPAADAFLQELDQNDQIITLSCNVTYWNHLHWKDTLSKEFCTQKQREYSFNQNRNGRIFTPELMINGQDSFVGSRRGKIIDHLSKNAKSTPALTVEQVGGKISIASEAQHKLHTENVVTLIAYGDKHTQFVPSGENRGRTIHYSNPVISMKKIAKNWDGDQTLIAQIDSDMPPSGYVVLVSDGEDMGGKILAAGKLKL